MHTFTGVCSKSVVAVMHVRSRQYCSHATPVVAPPPAPPDTTAPAAARLRLISLHAGATHLLPARLLSAECGTETSRPLFLCGNFCSFLRRNLLHQLLLCIYSLGEPACAKRRLWRPHFPGSGCSEGAERNVWPAVPKQHSCNRQPRISHAPRELVLRFASLPHKAHHPHDVVFQTS